MSTLESTKKGEIVGRYLAGKESEDDRRELKNWLDEDEANRELFHEINNEKNISSAIELFDSFNVYAAWKKYMHTHALSSYRKTIIRWQVAAVFFFLVGCGGVIAYLTTTTGERSFTTVSTNKGQNSKVTLPDGSIVWVSSGTTLSYNTNFGEKERSIKLSGEAFFEIAKNKDKPLVVDCNDLKIRVLGTKFDVSAYPEDHSVDVVLESGSVELTSGTNQSLKKQLVPGEMARFDVVRKELVVSREANYKFTSWKDGILIFRDDSMGEVLKKLERWYNIDIKVESPNINQLVFNATIVNENVEDIFDLIKFSCGINYRIIRSDNPTVPVQVILTK